jgi:hypothetical protein
MKDMKTTLIKSLVVLGLFSSCKNSTQQACDKSHKEDSIQIVEEKNDIICQIRDEISKSSTDTLLVETVLDSTEYIPNSVMITEGLSAIGTKWIIPPMKYAIVGDLNNDNKNDFIIPGTCEYGANGAMPVYFVFIKMSNGYKLYEGFKNFELAYTDSSQNKNPMEYGHFHVERIENGMIVGNTEYHKGDEEFYFDYSYTCKEEKYRINFKTNKVELVSKSPLVKERRL